MDFKYTYEEINKLVQQHQIPHYRISQPPGSIVIVPNEFLHTTTIVSIIFFKLYLNLK